MTALTSSPSLSLSNVVKRFGRALAVNSLSAEIFPGKLTGLVGPDGAGKTTLIRLMAGLMMPSEGTISVLGRELGSNTARGKDDLAELIGYMPQRFGLYEDLSVMENLRLYAALRGLTSGDQTEIFTRLLDFTRLAPFVERLAGKLSGGMKQKLGLACALMASPKVLLLDEPGVGVDPVSRQDLWRMVKDLVGDGIAVVWATAYLDEAERCDQVLLMNQGELKFSGAPSALTARLDERSFRFRSSSASPGKMRALLQEILDLPSVCDGVIQGASLRVVLRAETDKAEKAKKANTTALYALAVKENAELIAVPARFEDAFVDLLGGGPGGTSALAAKMPPVTLTMEHVVECRQLTRRFGAFTATHNVSFQVKRGEIFGLLGPNGAGKSTTFNMLCGLLKPSSGEAHVVGFDLRHAGSEAKGKLGYMAQKFSLYGLLSVAQNLEFSAGVYGLSGAEKRERIDEMVQTFQLTRYLKSSPDELPLGFKQRLALACALMHRPPVLFLDEPTSGVDPITRREFWTHINGLVQKGVTVLVTTHFMDEAEYCDRVALMYRAELIALDSPDALKASVASAANPDPSMEDAFIELIKRIDEKELIQ